MEMINREELAWAAGFYDGEGTIWGRRNRSGIVARIAQNHRPPLERFRLAVLGRGRVTGPYQRRAGNPFWVWTASSFEDTQAVIAALWPFLCEPKRFQAYRELSGWLKPPHLRGGVCKRGHNDWVIYGHHGRRGCRTCRRLRAQARVVAATSIN